MNNLQDLNIEEEILPLFDYSLNKFAKNKILKILKTPLETVDLIVERQNILRGFAANEPILKEYSYTVLYVNEVYFFLNTEKIEDLSQMKMRYKLFASQQEKMRYRGKFNQLILFFHRLQSRYFTRLDLKQFPPQYRVAITTILQFMSHFDLHKYELLIREGRLKDKHIIALTEIISTLKLKGLIAPFYDDLFLFEAYLSISNAISRNKFVFPNFAEGRIMLSDFYHPLVKNPIKNDFETATNVILLNGPNMSGKSTFLKSVGLCIYLGHLGIAIPASAGEMPFLNHFSIQINRRDDILNGYSHFMTEVVSLKNVVEKAAGGTHCFAIFDELFSGTNVEDAFEICKTTINGLTKFKNSFFIISTHIQELKNGSNSEVSNYYIDCELINNKPTFTYTLKKGWSDIRVGRILFDKEGLNDLLK